MTVKVQTVVGELTFRLPSAKRSWHGRYLFSKSERRYFGRIARQFRRRPWRMIRTTDNALTWEYPALSEG